MKQLNLEWMQTLLNEKTDKDFNNVSDLPKAEWVQNGKGFKKEAKFKVIGANSKENNIFVTIAATHWNLGPNKDQRFVCPEQTNHLKGQGRVCPVCEAKRKLLAMGFKEEDLTTQGKFGPLPIFDPTLTSNVKVVMLDSDTKKDWDKEHISILQQKGTFLARWLVEKYVDSETPDLLAWDASNAIRFSRPTENGKWDREVSFAQYTPSQEVIAKLREENEALTLPDLWRMPSDEEFLKIGQVVNDMKEGFIQARNTMTSSTSTVSDVMPF